MSIKDLINAEYFFRIDDGQLDINLKILCNPDRRIYTCMQDEIAAEWLYSTQASNTYFVFHFDGMLGRLVYMFFDEQVELLFRLAVPEVSTANICSEVIDQII